jgi:hypothetical protein
MGYKLFDLHGKPAVIGEELVEFNVVAVAEDAPPVMWVDPPTR